MHLLLQFHLSKTSWKSSFLRSTPEKGCWRADTDYSSSWLSTPSLSRAFSGLWRRNDVAILPPSPSTSWILLAFPSQLPGIRMSEQRFTNPISVALTEDIQFSSIYLRVWSDLFFFSRGNWCLPVAFPSVLELLPGGGRYFPAGRCSASGKGRTGTFMDSQMGNPHCLEGGGWQR